MIQVTVTKKILGGMIVAVILTLCSGSAVKANGSPPVINIGSCVELQKIGNDPAYPLDGNYLQTDNINCTATIPSSPANVGSPWTDGKGFAPIGANEITPFTGTYDGNSRLIENLNIIRADDTPGLDGGTPGSGADYQYVGLFGYTYGATVKDLALTYTRVKGYYDVGGLVGYSKDSTLANVSVNKDFSSAAYNDNSSNNYFVWARYGERGGGIVGTLDGGTLTNAHSGANVKGSGIVIGGLVGWMKASASIVDSSSSATIDGGYNVGGLVGHADTVSISNSSATGDVFAVYEWDYNKLGSHGGGLIGYATNTLLTGVSASGDVSGYGQIGGLVGVYVDAGSLANTISASGDVSGQEDLGGMFGQAGCAAQISDGTASGSVTGLYGNIGGFVGRDIGTDYCGFEINGASYSDSEASGAVSGDTNVGGFIGFGITTDINSSSAYGAVSGQNNIGGFGGTLYESTIDGSTAAGITEGEEYIGGFFGFFGCNSTVSNSSASGNVTATGFSVGGFTGLDGCEGPGSDYTSVSATGDVIGQEAAGGLIGAAFYTQIDQSFATGTVTAENRAGGLVGTLNGCGYDCEQSSYIRESFATGNVSSAVMGEVGGLVGLLDGAEVADSYARGEVSGDSFAGGLVGLVENNNLITRSFATGLVSASTALGGLVGSVNQPDNTIEYSFWDRDTSGLNTSDAGTGKTTEQMKDIVTFTTDLGDNAWDFDTVWNIEFTKNDGYPCLQWSTESCAIKESSDNSVNFISPLTNKGIKLQLSNECSFEALFKAEQDLNAPNDIAYDYPNGLVGFNADCGQNGFTTTVTQYYVDVIPSSVILRKYNPTTKTYFTISDAQIEQVSLDGKPVTKVTYQVTDGSERDADGLVDGKISDPAGLAQSVVNVPNTGLQRIF